LSNRHNEASYFEGLSRSAIELKSEVNSKEDLQGIKFVLMSSAFEKIDEEKIDQLHFNGRLVKPFDPANLRQVLKVAIGKESAPEPPPMKAAPEPPVAAIPSVPPISPAASMDLTDFSKTDIRQMTEETLNISESASAGQWTINESALDEPEETIVLDETKPSVVGEDTLTDLQNIEPSIVPPPNLMDLGGIEIEANMPPPPPPSSPSEIPEIIPLSGDQVNHALNDQLQESVEKWVERMLPDMAEKIIRDEIHRMLADPPSG